MVRTISPVLYDAMIYGKETRVHAINMKPKTENWTEKQLQTEIRDKDYTFVLWDDDHGIYRLKSCSHKVVFPGTGLNQENAELGIYQGHEEEKHCVEESDDD